MMDGAGVKGQRQAWGTPMCRQGVTACQRHTTHLPEGWGAPLVWLLGTRCPR